MKKNSYLIYGFATVAVMIVVGFLIIYMGAALNKGMSLLIQLPFCAGIVLNAFAYSKANDGYVTFGDAFKSCFKAVLVIMAVRIAWIPVSDFLFPHVKELALAEMHDKLSKNPGINEEQQDTFSNFFIKYWGAIMFLGVMLGTLFMGSIYAVIAAAIAPKKGTRPPQGDNF